MKKQKEFELHKKIRGPKWYLRPIEMVGAWIFAGPFGTRTKIKKINCEGLKGPFILLSNHASFVDFANVIKSGCVELEHQRLIVVTLTPNCSANQRPVLSFSTRTILIRFKPLIAYLFKFAAKLLTYIVIRKNITC